MDKEVEELKNKLDKYLGLKSEVVIDKLSEVGLLYRSPSGIVLFSVTFWYDTQWELWEFHSPSLEDMRKVLVCINA